MGSSSKISLHREVNSLSLVLTRSSELIVEQYLTSDTSANYLRITKSAMFKFLALVVILAVVVNGYPAAEEANNPLSAGGETVLPKPQDADQEGADGSDLSGSETFGFGFYPGYSRGFGGYGGYGGGWGYSSGYGGYGGYGRGWGHGGYGYPRRYYW